MKKCYSEQMLRISRLHSSKVACNGLAMCQGWTTIDPFKALMYGELDKGTRPVGRPKLRYKDTCKSILKSGRILDQWQDLVVNRLLSRRTIGNVCRNVNVNQIAIYQRRKEHRARKKAISGN